MDLSTWTEYLKRAVLIPVRVLPYFFEGCIAGWAAPLQERHALFVASRLIVRHDMGGIAHFVACVGSFDRPIQMECR
jgi:hypothetical protein